MKRLLPVLLLCVGCQSSPQIDPPPPPAVDVEPVVTKPEPATTPIPEPVVQHPIVEKPPQQLPPEPKKVEPKPAPKPPPTIIPTPLPKPTEPELVQKYSWLSCIEDDCVADRALMNDRKSEIEETIITLFKEDKDLGWWAAFRAKRLLSKYNDSNACDVDLYPTIYNEFANLLGEGPLQDYLFTNHVEYLTIRCYKYKDNNDV